MDFYYAEGDAQRGPVPAAQLRALGVGPETLVWHEGMASWQRADAVPELRAMFAPPAAPSAPPGGYPAPQPQYAPPQQQYPTPQPQYAAPAYQQAGYAAPQAAPMAGYSGYAPPMTAQLPTNGMAIASLVLGILSLPVNCFTYGFGGFIPAVLAVIFGHMARGKARRGEAGGDGMALAGLICGYIALALSLIIILLFILGIAAAGMSGRW